MLVDGHSERVLGIIGPTSHSQTLVSIAEFHASPDVLCHREGFEILLPKNVSPDIKKTCETSKSQLTPQLTPKSLKQGEIDTSELHPDLAEIVAVWPELPEHIKAAIKALVQTHNREGK
jgi:hypothetical protein